MLILWIKMLAVSYYLHIIVRTTEHFFNGLNNFLNSHDLDARRKTIYEYHRVSFGNAQITNSTIIYFTALPTCLQYTDCTSCLNHNTDFTVSNHDICMYIHI